MKPDLNMLPTTIVRTLLFCIAIVLSCNVFAAKPLQLIIGGAGPGGGIIFHISDDGKHGIEAAPLDQSTSRAWDFAGSGLVTFAVKAGIFDGSFNTDRTISTLGYQARAAIICAKYDGGGYGDWYLPSQGELKGMYDDLYLSQLGGFTEDFYWSSTESSSASFAHVLHFGTGVENQVLSKSTAVFVRCIREF